MKFILETDSAGVATIINSGKDNRSEIWNAYREANRLKKTGQCINVVYIFRKCNQAAHVLAKFAREERSVGVLFGSVPACVRTAAATDCNDYFS